MGSACCVVEGPEQVIRGLGYTVNLIDDNLATRMSLFSAVVLNGMMMNSEFHLVEMILFLVSWE